MTGHIKGLGRGRDKGRKGAQWYIRYPNGRRQFFPSEAKRDSEYESFSGLVQPALNLKPTVSELEMLRQIRALADSRGFERDQIMSILREAAPIRNRRWHALCDEYKALRKRDWESGSIGGKSWSNIRNFCELGKRLVPDCEMIRFDPDAAREASAERYPSPNSANTAIRHLNMILAHGERSGCVSARTRIRSIRGAKAPKEIFKRRDAEALLDLAWRKHGDLVPVVALQWLAGIRPTATYFMRWRSIDFEEGVIWLEDEIHKTEGFDCVEHLPRKVFEVLGWFAGEPDDRIAPSGYQKLMKKFRADAIEEVGLKRWPEDVARHTFCSHLAAMTGDLDKARRTMCHQKESVMLKHYLRRVSREEGCLYFGDEIE